MRLKRAQVLQGGNRMNNAVATHAPEDLGHTAMEFLTAFTGGDPEKAWSFCADEFRWILMDKRMGGGVPAAFSKDDYMKMVSGFAGVFPQVIKMDFQAPLVGKDRVAIEAQSEGLLSTGVVYANLYVFVLRFSAGRIKEIREYLDSGYAHVTLDAVSLGS